MKITLLGTGGYFANSRRQTACLLLPEEGIVFDAGSGVYRLPQLCRQPEIHFFLTHPHLDHIVGLPTLLIPILNQQFQTVRVHANRQTLAAVERHLFSQAVFPVPMPFECCEIPASGAMEVRPGLTIHWQSLPSHPGGSTAYRIDAEEDAGRCSVAYITDTSVDGSYHEFIANVDLLIHECYFDDARANLAERTGHSYASQVAQLAADVQARELVIVHLDPTIDRDDPVGLPEMRAIFSKIRIGVDGMELSVGRDTAS